MKIEVKNLYHIYNEKTENRIDSLKDISVHFNDHFITGLVGKTGSGKSTFSQHLNYLLNPISGLIEIDNILINGKKLKTKDILLVRKTVAYLFQSSDKQLFSDTVLKELMVGPLNFGMSKEEAKKNALESLKLVGLDESFLERSPIELSGGEKRKVAIASIISSKPKCIIFDEPTAGLDYSSKQRIIDLIKELYQRNISILIVTHDMDFLYEVCDDVILLNDGNLIKHEQKYEFFMDDVTKYGLTEPKIFKFCKDFEDLKWKKCCSISELIEVIKNG